MDFASLMSKTLSKSSTPTPPPAPKADSKSPTPPKFISRREAEEARKAAYIAEQQRIEAERAAKANAKRKREMELAEEAKAREEKRRRLAEESRRRRQEKEAEEERARRRRLGLPEIPPTEQKEDATAKGEEDDDDLDEDGDAPGEEEVRSELRALGEPVTLFGETPAARLKRFRRLTGAVVQPNGPVPTTLPPVEEKDMKVGAVPKPEDKKARRYLYRQLASYFNMVLREWERALADEGAHDTTAGKQAVSAMLSSKESMKAVCVPPVSVLPPLMLLRS